MSAFEYTALTASGGQERGLIEGDTARHARSALRDRGLMPLEIREVQERSAQQSQLFGGGGGSISTTELTLFTRQLATLVRSGLPLDEALAAVSQQSESKRVKRIALGVRSSVLEGSSLAQALNQFPNAFPPLFRATVEAGEQSGKLDYILERLAEYVERRQELQQKVLLASLYPVILTVVAIGVVVLLLAYVVPQVVGVYGDIKQELPGLTKGLIALSDFVRDYGLYVGAALIAALFVFSRMMRNEDFRRKVHHIQLRLPLIGRLTRGANTGRFTRTLGILFGSGVPILDAMRIGTQVVSNVPMRDAIDIATSKVREGAPLARSLGESKLFPPIALHLIASGESSGRLDEMLDNAARNQEREVETLIGALVAILGPVLILAMGGIVLLIVLAILLPIFDLNQLVK
ncbi:general secretion pathway protein F [Panacagrimonas perspica]|uniref:General secretion pathway protein F n=1 Tax=Panacagrimonas perspica TaxID=381431 RepID=A0A4R7PFK1_9GAMM|nr:type II secretion system inner membrane protein GspF [Panacagrimonas perspica]TDU32907.1 general secretion pathway protein F [Panacagrimonas perspica]THD02690.1 type II secretion system protein GspF [Panacagrimonas perspica]